LLLTHCYKQSITQKKIEAYLGAAPSVLSPDEDPKSMIQRHKITEIYILHVLPAERLWDYAREFTRFSPDIDEEQKEVCYLSSGLCACCSNMRIANLPYVGLAAKRRGRT
jgi:hypothetical protein